MEETFITSIKINKVRHLEGLEIQLSDTERKHLILTGKNGSGKTSVLEALRDLLQYCVKNKDGVGKMYEAFMRSEAQVQLAEMRQEVTSEIQKRKLFQKSIESFFDGFFSNFTLQFRSQILVRNNGIPSDFVMAYFSANHQFNPQISNGPTKIDLGDSRDLSDDFSNYFVQYLVNRRSDLLEEKEDGNAEKAEKIKSWFDSFEDTLKYIFSDENLDLHYDRKIYNYYISQNGRQSFSLNELSAGYAVFINIIAELIMRMESQGSHAYDLQGIVLIDEIETHLHIDLQKKILPFLTSFFPKIQFIVTTHSPFVLSSVDNAVIYDLEKQIRVEDLSGYSYSNIVKSYFGADEYSAELRKKVSEYETLLNLNDLNLSQKERLYELKLFFKELPKSLSPELQLKISQLELAELAA